MVTGDNLQINEVGLKMAFNNNSFCCRFCVAEGRPNAQLSIQSNDHHFALLDGNKNPPNRIRPFVFQNLPGITMNNSFPPDPTHDLAEGVVPNVLLSILKSLVTTKKITQKEILEQFSKYEQYLSEGIPQLQAVGSTEFKLTGKAIQVS